MIWVTLRNGTVLQYNTGGVFEWSNGNVAIATRMPVLDNAVADIAGDLVARVEFIRPCRIIPPPRRRKR